MKNSKPPTSLRKSPKQARSRELVDTILEAATRILESTGIGSVGTNKIAEKSGVSIGSLYQYFPNKDAIYAKVIERQMNKNAERFRKVIKEHSNRDPREIVDALVADVVDLFFEKKVMFSALFAEVPRLEKTREVLTKRNKTIEIFNELLNRYRNELNEPDRVEEIVYVFSHSIVGVLQTAALENFETCPPERIKRQLQAMARRFIFC